MGDNFFFKAARYTVSADKNRYQESRSSLDRPSSEAADAGSGSEAEWRSSGGEAPSLGSGSPTAFDLDLTYVTERIIAMAFPADGVESAFRNNIDRVAELLNSKHRDRYLIYNLTSERLYDYDKFNRQVITWCGFPDHNPPPLNLLFRIVHSMYAWLCADARNVAVVHCLAGKGRTGTVIACFFLFVGLFTRPVDALNFFGVRRSHNNWGVTGPSQLRYVDYFDKVFTGQLVPSPDSLILANVTFTGVPAFNLAPGKQGCCPIFEIYAVPTLDLLFSSDEAPDRELGAYLTTQKTVSITAKSILPATDLLVTFKHVTPLYGTEPMFHFGFNVGLVTGTPKILRIEKSGLDRAYKDARFPPNFAVTLYFRELAHCETLLDPAPLPPSPPRDDPAYERRSPSPLASQATMTSSSSSSPPPSASPLRSAAATTASPLRSAAATTASQRPASPSPGQPYWQLKPNTGLAPGAVCFHPTSNLARKLALARDIGIPGRGLICEKGGFLVKQGHVRKNWRRRWFALHCSGLLYFKSPRDSRPSGAIALESIVSVTPTQDVLLRGVRLDGFVIATHTPDRTYAITAEEPADVLHEWMAAIQQARLKLQPRSAYGELRCALAKLRCAGDDDAAAARLAGNLLMITTRSHQYTVPVAQLLEASRAGQLIELSFQIFRPESDFLSVTLWSPDDVAGAPSTIVGTATVPLAAVPTKPSSSLRQQWLKLNPPIFGSAERTVHAPDVLVNIVCHLERRRDSTASVRLNVDSPESREAIVRWNQSHHPFDSPLEYLTYHASTPSSSSLSSLSK